VKTTLEQAIELIEELDETELAFFKALQEKMDKEIIEALLKGDDE
jgi:hypothetical protein